MYNHAPKAYLCPICNLVRGVETESNRHDDIVLEDEAIISFISPKWWPHNPGHVMVCPKTHFENIYDITDDLLTRIQLASKRIAIAMKETYHCDGVSTRQHNEPAGNQDVWHFHLHVFPRYPADNLYLNHTQARFVRPPERLPYANLLRHYFV